MPSSSTNLALLPTIAVLATASIAGCDDGEVSPTVAGATSSLWVTFALENEVDRGAIAYTTFRHEDEDGDSLELPAGDNVSCNGRRLEKTVEAWTLITYYRVVMPEVGEGESFTFVLSRSDGEILEASVTMPSVVLVDEDASDDEVQLGRDAEVALSGGSADELEVSLVAECLSPVSVSLSGDSESATVPGERIECACIAGGRVPPCDGLVRAQRINRSAPPEAFAGGETLGVQRHEVDIHVIE